MLYITFYLIYSWVFPKNSWVFPKKKEWNYRTKCPSLILQEKLQIEYLRDCMTIVGLAEKEYNQNYHYR